MLVPLGLAASLVVATQAILLPPSVSLDSLDIDGNLDASLIDPYTQLVEVPCVGCPYGQPNANGVEWVEGIENSLVLNISVGAQPETLELNGFRFYPPPMGIMMTPPAPSIAQVPSDLSLAEIREKPEQYLSQPLLVTGWSFRAGSSHTASESGEEVLTMTLHISSLAGQSVAVPDINIKSLKGPDAKLLILGVISEPASSIPTSPEEQQKQECENWPLLCKWKAIFANKLQGVKTSLGKLKGCHKRPGSGMMHHRPAHNMHHNEEPHKKPHHHHDHHRLHSLFRAISHVTLSIFVPVLVGIAVGTMTYIVGMLIGCTAAFIWARLRPSGGAYVALSADGEEGPSGSGDSEKEVYVFGAESESEDKYEVAPPVYEEVEKEVVVEQQ